MARSGKIAQFILLSAIVGPIVLLLSWGAYTRLNDHSANPLTYLDCTSETRMEIHNVAGADFNIEYSSCDGIAKDEEIRVYALRPMIGGLLTKRSVVFGYDPWNYDEPLPRISASPSGQINISVPRVSSIVMQKLEWNGRQINYDIGRIEYPEYKSNASASK